MAFAQDIKAALDLVGAAEKDPVVDFIMDPGAACRALDALPEHAGLVFRGLPALGEDAGGHGPLPADPVWVRLMRGARELGTAQLRGGDGMVRRAASVELRERDEVCCDLPACKLSRTHAEVWLLLEESAGGDTELLVAEERAASGPPDVARGIAARLGKALDVPVKRGGEAFTDEPGEAPEPSGASPSAVELSRLTVRSEGERLVVRDWDSAGPRAAVGQNLVIGGILAVIAAGLWVMLARALGGAEVPGGAVGAGMAATLMTLGAYTFLAVAQYAGKYKARSAPMLSIARDRAAVLPWVSREGAVDVRPEGRVGAALPLVEVKGASFGAGAGGVAVRLETDLGPYDVAILETEDGARAWSVAVERALDEMRHPQAGATARQRARARAAA
jgi:hypothetical protein